MSNSRTAKLTLFERLLALVPPPEWRLPVIVALGLFFGMSGAIFHISNASSYLSDEPATCMNCHVMTPHYASHQRSSHARVASCNDCHVPHDNLFATYGFKAIDGVRHASIYTLRLEPQVIRIKPMGKRVVEQNCIRCHQTQLAHAALSGSESMQAHFERGLESRSCIECHRETPHGRVASLSSYPDAGVPAPAAVLPAWLEQSLARD